MHAYKRGIMVDIRDMFYEAIMRFLLSIHVLWRRAELRYIERRPMKNYIKEKYRYE